MYVRACVCVDWIPLTEKGLVAGLAVCGSQL